MKIVDVRRPFFVMTMTFVLCHVSCEHISIQQPTPNSLVIQSHEIWRQANSPIILAVDVTVTAVGMLEIEPGTEIHFANGSVVVPDPAGDMRRSPTISVYGKLICKGTPDKMIKFDGHFRRHTVFSKLKSADNQQYHKELRGGILHFLRYSDDTPQQHCRQLYKYASNP